MLGEGQHPGSSILGAFKGGNLEELPEKDLNTIFISFPGIFSGLSSLLTGQHQDRESVVNAAGPDVSHSIPCLVLLLFWAWS